MPNDSGALILPPEHEMIGPQLPEAAASPLPADQAAAVATAPVPAVSPAPEADREAQASD